jgi:hypothetical protein
VNAEKKLSVLLVILGLFLLKIVVYTKSEWRVGCRVLLILYMGTEKLKVWKPFIYVIG